MINVMIIGQPRATAIFRWQARLRKYVCGNGTYIGNSPYVHLFLKRWNEWLRLIWHQCVLLKENNGYLLFLNCCETIWNGFEATIKDILMTTKTVDSAVWEKKISLEASVCLLQVSKCFELSCQIALGISQMYIWLKVNWKKRTQKGPENDARFTLL